jgi:hypothetical protein
MTLINDPASLPAPMWAVVRFLISAGGHHPTDSAQAILCPPTLLPEANRAKDETFNSAVRSLRELGLVTADGGQLSLSPPARRLAADDADRFCALLRAAVLDPGRNPGLSESDDQTGPKDLVRALTWFLSCDPFTSLNWYNVTQLQIGALVPQVGLPIRNGFRWNRFAYWAPALGLASEPVLEDDRPEDPLLPDCTVAVRQAVHAAWEKDQRVEAAEAAERIVADLPVLPGGRYSQSLGLRPPAHVSPTLSYALLCGHDQGWIRLEHRSDAARDILLADPDTATGTRRVSDITITGSPRD